MEVSDNQDSSVSNKTEQNEIISDENKTDTVKYDTYKRTLGEAKRAKEEARELREKIEAFQNLEKDREMEELDKQKNYQEKLRIREEELKKAKDELFMVKGSVTNAIKKDAFLQALQGVVPKEYHSLIPMEKIVYDHNTGEIDEMSLSSAVDEFRKVHHRVIDSRDVSKLPNEKPSGVGSNVTGGNKKLSSAEEMKSLASDLSKYL